jgi:hypothetical protein
MYQRGRSFFIILKSSFMKTEIGFSVVYRLNRLITLGKTVICANLKEKIDYFTLIESMPDNIHR